MSAELRRGAPRENTNPIHRPLTGATLFEKRVAPLQGTSEDAALREIRSTVSEVPLKGELKQIPDLPRTTEREILKREKGCVVRSLGSALGAVAAESEWQDRFNQMNDTGQYADMNKKYPNLTEKQKAFVDGQKIAYADAQVANLIRDFRKHDSAVGAALRNKEVEEYGRQDEAGIRALLEAGRAVTIIGKVEGGNRHMVHITQDEHGRLFAKSDNGGEVTLEGEYTTIAFADKGAILVELPAREKTQTAQLPHLNEIIKYAKVK